MLSQSLVLETKHAHGVVQLTLNRPSSLNAFNTNLYNNLTKALQTHNNLPTTRLIILTGAGKHFCGGMDIKEAHSGTPQVRTLTRAAQKFMQALLAFEKPVIVAAFGAVTGIAMTMLMHCDAVLAAEGSSFRTPFVRVGIVPEFGSSVMFPRRLGVGLSMRLLMKGERVSAGEMERQGVCQVVEGGRDAVVNKAVRIAEQWSAGMLDEEWQGVVLAKRLMRQDLREVLDRAMENEFQLIQQRIDDGSAERGMKRGVEGMGMRKARM